MSSIDVKIRKLDGELLAYKDQLAKLRPGPGKNAVQQRALRVLKQKKMYEAQIAQLTQQSFNMESAAMMTENLRNTMATVDAMQLANKELRKQYGKVDVDKIEVSTQVLSLLSIEADLSREEHTLRNGRLNRAVQRDSRNAFEIVCST